LLKGAQRLAVMVAGSALALVAGVPAMAVPASTVTIARSSFSPNPVDVPVGTQVRWTNEDGFEHTVTSDDGRSFDSGPLAKDQVFPHTFDQPGSYTYHCKIHPSMQATVVVRGEVTTTTAPPDTTTTTEPSTTTTVIEPVAEQPVPTTSPPGPVPSPVSKTPKTIRVPVTTTAPVQAEVASGPATLAAPPTPPAPGATPDATQPPSAVALGVARGRAEKGTSFGGLAAAGGIALALAGGWWAVRTGRRSRRR
jgi:plastocyanin